MHCGTEAVFSETAKRHPDVQRPERRQMHCGIDRVFSETANRHLDLQGLEGC